MWDLIDPIDPTDNEVNEVSKVPLVPRRAVAGGTADVMRPPFLAEFLEENL
jgi:hypothetical protein